ncbi:MAG TPA: hypothetical protein VMG74_06305 [Gaiellaceae bacterium]|nr:hypothetical protein [Gaiellaceae bacterium]
MSESRSWALVLDTTSPEAAGEIGRSLEGDAVDVDVEGSAARVWLFADNRAGLEALERRIAELVVEPEALQGPPMSRVWSEKHSRYVDPSAPDEDPDTRELWIDSQLEPQEIHWLVRVDLLSPFEFRRVRKQLPTLGRPVIATGKRNIDLGARDAQDADWVAAHVASLPGVGAAYPREIRGRIARWKARQRVAGNYAAGGEGGGYGYHDFGGAHGGGGHGGGDGGGGHGGGGHGGH